MKYRVINFSNGKRKEIETEQRISNCPCIGDWFNMPGDGIHDWKIDDIIIGAGLVDFYCHTDLNKIRGVNI